MKFRQRTGAYKVSNRPITTFSIASSPIIYRAKAFAYVTILTSKSVAFHRALTDFKKRQKFHFWNKNFNNHFSFPDVFVCNFATIPPSSSYHLVQFLKYYKTMPFSKIRNTGHCANHKEKHSKGSMLYIFWRFLIGKIEMIHFSALSHSIELFKFYKNISFTKIKNIDDLIITKAKCRRTMTFLLVLMISLRKTISDLYT